MVEREEEEEGCREVGERARLEGAVEEATPGHERALLVDGGAVGRARRCEGRAEDQWYGGGGRDGHGGGEPPGPDIYPTWAYYACKRAVRGHITSAKGKRRGTKTKSNMTKQNFLFFFKYPPPRQGSLRRAF